MKLANSDMHINSFQALAKDKMPEFESVIQSHIMTYCT
jgi:hypothetical protein